MILIADSGSTKTDWALVNKVAETLYFSTVGLNPNLNATASITSFIKKNKELCSYKNKIKEIYFYGAGCSDNTAKKQITTSLSAIFSNSKINVYHDLEGAVYVTGTTEPRIVCILGTGSNSCYFDGENTIEKYPSLGFIIGDEGSGNQFGKKILRAYFYKEMPLSITNDFELQFNVKKEFVINQLYHKKQPNKYLAAFAPFLSKHKNTAFAQQILNDSFKEFLQIHVCCFPQYKTVPCCFVGSIAKEFQTELKLACQKLNITMGTVVKKPIDGLIIKVIELY